MSLNEPHPADDPSPEPEAETLPTDKPAADQTIRFQYSFRLEDDQVEKTFVAELNARDLSLVHTARPNYPAWTELACAQCPHCPLHVSTHPHCPIAVHLVDLVEFFRGSLSYEEVDVQVKTSERQYTKRTTVQRALSSLLGVYMVTSGCPVMDKLRPMVRFHLPLATPEETSYRVISMYLIAQYLRYRRGKRPDWTLDRLISLYEDVHVVNTNFLERLRHIEQKDASANALIILDSFANHLMFSIDQDHLEEIEILFKGYLDEE